MGNNTLTQTQISPENKKKVSVEKSILAKNSNIKFHVLCKENIKEGIDVLETGKVYFYNKNLNLLC